MTVTAIPITDHDQWMALRRQDVTASVAAAVLGVHPYKSHWALWMDKAGRMAPEPVQSEPVISDDGNEIVLPPAGRGHAREREVVELVRHLRPAWDIQYPVGLYLRDTATRIGATPDALVACPERGPGIVQVKTVDPIKYREEWIDPDTREAVPPLHILVQTLVEARLVGAVWAAVAVHREEWGSRPSVRLVDVPVTGATADRLWERLKTEVAAFWQSIADCREPDPDFRRDAAAVMRLHAAADGDMIDVEGERAERLSAILALRAGLKAREKDGAAAEKDRKPLDAEIIHILGNATAARLPDGRIVAVKAVSRKGFTVQPSTYRTVREA